ncbi:MAG: hypothetical protein IKF99_08595 [Oscillospiraceae bacterium]|nr:hypothetical protein [Oscillospiraceae bacterium]
MNDIFVREIELPYKYKGFIKEDEDGNYNIYVRRGDPPEVQRETVRHEVEHAIQGHLQRDRDLEECEEEAEAAIHKELPRGWSLRGWS